MMIGFIIGWFVDFYAWLTGLVWWFIGGLQFMISDPELFFEKYGLLIAFVIFIAVSIISILNWVSKRWPFNMLYLAPPDKPRRGRYLGRKLFFIRNGSFFYNRKVKEKYRNKFDGLCYFVEVKTLWKIPIGFNVDKILIPKANRETWAFKGSMAKWKKDLYIFYKGHKEFHQLSSKIASNDSKATTPSVGPEFYTESSKSKLNLADKLAQQGVTSNAESQQYQLALGSVPHEQEYAEFEDKDIAAMKLEEETGRKIDPEELSESQIRNVMKELEVGADG